MTDKPKDRGGADGPAATVKEAIMTRIVIPLGKKPKGAEIADLQDALRDLLDAGALLSGDDAGRRELAEALKSERGKQIFSDVTKRLVGLVQTKSGLEASGRVDEATAEAL